MSVKQIYQRIYDQQVFKEWMASIDNKTFKISSHVLNTKRTMNNLVRNPKPCHTIAAFTNNAFFLQIYFLQRIYSIALHLNWYTFFLLFFKSILDCGWRFLKTIQLWNLFKKLVIQYVVHYFTFWNYRKFSIWNSRTSLLLKYLTTGRKYLLIIITKKLNDNLMLV